MKYYLYWLSSCRGLILSSYKVILGLLLLVLVTSDSNRDYRAWWGGLATLLVGAVLGVYLRVAQLGY